MSPSALNCAPGEKPHVRRILRKKVEVRGVRMADGELDVEMDISIRK